MPKKDFGEVLGKCKICTINLWSKTEGLPVILPCNINNGPYEDSSSQHAHHAVRDHGFVGSGLGRLS